MIDNKLRPIFYLFLFVLGCIFANLSFGQNHLAPEVFPDDEKRSSIHTIDGYAYLTNTMTIAETRTAAFAEAKRLALEAAKILVKANLVNNNLEVVKDDIETVAYGSVNILEQKDLGVEDNKRYHVWIKAEVQYGSPGKPAPAPLTYKRQSPLLTVDIWTRRRQYKDGETIKINLRTNRDCFVRIVDIAAGGEIIQLLPNDFRSLNFLEGGKIYQIPDKEDRFVLRVSPPLGEEQIVVYASECPLGHIPLKPIGQGLGSFPGSRKALGIKTRGISIVPAASCQAAGAQFYEATWKLKTVK